MRMCTLNPEMGFKITTVGTKDSLEVIHSKLGSLIPRIFDFELEMASQLDSMKKGDINIEEYL